eukprot:COSAG03_NODE_2411_length_2798_cov_68.246758_4_plen_56_part_00
MPTVGEVLLYVPNLIGYARLACIIYGFHAPGVFDSAVRLRSIDRLLSDEDCAADC